MKYILWVVSLPVMVLAVVFAVANRHMTQIDLWPLDMSVDIPMYIVVLVSLFVGFLLGGIVAWVSAGSARGRARSALYRAEQLERENARLRKAPPASASNSIVSGSKQLTTRAAG